jgi:hypothetical protein
LVSYAPLTAAVSSPFLSFNWRRRWL